MEKELFILRQFKYHFELQIPLLHSSPIPDFRLSIEALAVSFATLILLHIIKSCLNPDPSPKELNGDVLDNTTVSCHQDPDFLKTSI